jgi:hypothetical protein
VATIRGRAGPSGFATDLSATLTLAAPGTCPSNSRIACDAHWMKLASSLSALKPRLSSGAFLCSTARATSESSEEKPFIA